MKGTNTEELGKRKEEKEKIGKKILSRLLVLTHGDHRRNGNEERTSFLSFSLDFLQKGERRERERKILFIFPPFSRFIIAYALFLKRFG